MKPRYLSRDDRPRLDSDNLYELTGEFREPTVGELYVGFPGADAGPVALSVMSRTSDFVTKYGVKRWIVRRKSASILRVEETRLFLIPDRALSEDEARQLLRELDEALS